MKKSLHDRGVIARYKDWLPVTEATPVISLNEGSTPLIHSPKLSERTGAEVYLKFEGLNPTGSFKDRGMTVALSKAVERGASTVICASTGNTSAAAAAYAARASIRCAVILPAGKIAAGKLVQAFAYGAKVVAIRGNFDDALRIVREFGGVEGVAIVNSINPDRIEGQKTASFEIIEELGDAPDIHILPVGNAGNITAYWKGYREFQTAGRSTKLPKMVGFQAEGAAPIYLGHPVEPHTVATAIRIGNPVNRDNALKAREESQGDFMAVTDAEIIEAYKLLGSAEGVFCEPASAASVAGLLKRHAEVPAGARVVCVLTGNGLKDPSTAIENNDSTFHTGLEADTNTVARVMGF